MEYAKKYTSSNKTHIWLGGSFLHGGATAYSDVDMSVYCNAETLKKLIYGYGQPIYVSYTKNPLGILIVIYEDGVALDLEIVEKVEATGNEYFHRLDIKENNYVRNDTVCKEFVFDDDTAYQISRLFHRSLIKYLSGKRDSGVSILNEIVTFMDTQEFVDESNYISRFSDILRNFHQRFPLPDAYYKLLCELVEDLDKRNL